MRVATAEAWRRRVKAKQHVPLIFRSPNIIRPGIIAYSVAQYAIAYPVHGARSSLEHVTAWNCGCAAWDYSCAASLKLWTRAADAGRSASCTAKRMVGKLIDVELVYPAPTR